MSVYNKVLDLLRKYKVEPDEDGNILVQLLHEGWTSVDEKLPDEEKWYLVCCKGSRGGFPFSSVATSFYFKNEWEFYPPPSMDGLEPTHWMPLPCPPKES